MERSTYMIRRRLLPCVLLALAAPLAAQEASTTTSQAPDLSSQVVSAQAQAVLDRMTATLQGLGTFSVSAQVTRDEVVALGYKLQNNEQVTMTVQRPNKLRSEITGDERNRTIVYDGATLAMYSPDDQAYVRSDAPDTLGGLITTLLDLGVEMPLIDVLYQGTAGSLTEGVRGGILVGESVIDGRTCDQLAFRQASIDWQIWVEQGARALPCKILITTRYEVGDPQFQAVMRWDLKPKLTASTFVFTAPEGATQIALAKPAAADASAP
jgi:hypothetical protein